MVKFLTNFALACGIFAILVAVGMNLVNVQRYRLNLTQSLPRGLYQLTDEPIQRGVLVAECLPPDLAALGIERGWLPTGNCPTHTAPILKEVAAVAGDTVELADEYIAVNEQLLLGTATLKTDSKGRDLPAVPRETFTLGEGELFLLGKSKNSWDNRNTGPAKVKDIVATARPVWVEGER